MTLANSDNYPLSTHLEELRTTLIRCSSVILAGFFIALFFYQDVFSIATSSLHDVNSPANSKFLQRQEIQRERIENKSANLDRYSVRANEVVAFSKNVQEIGDGVFLIEPNGYLDLETTKKHTVLAIFGPIDAIGATLKMSLWIAVVLTAPIWLFFVLSFIAPALKTHEKRLVFPFLSLSLIFLGFGALFAFYVTLPLSNAVLWAFNAELGENIWSLSGYLDYSLFLLLATALAFELSLLLFFLVHLNVITAEWMTSYRRHMVVAVFILSALLTPPDVPSQLMMALPLLGLYELGVLYARTKAYKQERSNL